MNTEKALADNQNWKEKYLETYISPDLDMAIIEGIQLMLEAIDSEIVKPLAANKPTQVEDWISVETELPKEGGRYWCYIRELTDLGFSYFQWNCYYDPQEKRFADSTLTNGENVTHWRYLPAAPIKPKEK